MKLFLFSLTLLPQKLQTAPFKRSNGKVSQAYYNCYQINSRIIRSSLKLAYKDNKHRDILRLKLIVNLISKRTRLVNHL